MSQPFNVVIPTSGLGVAVKDFEKEADKALEAYRASVTGEGDKLTIPAEQLEQIELCVKSAKSLVAAGLVGDLGVYAVVGGNANPEHEHQAGRLESLISIGIYQRPVQVAAADKARKRAGGGTTSNG